MAIPPLQEWRVLFDQPRCMIDDVIVELAPALLRQ
jgi:hypothetical protein